ncbi:benzoate/H(+) symporter BenE family transporter [Photobacterium damselae]|uniref:benzoate/H(+) symporter BenE family transporter n=1 Tax=Photobacterium damselae TaxID=38293 RepID=UPI0025438799|nr:benzoate/H(+) symporter BenE family transporter [Photobacterium damselae]WIH21286.1 benzoate/H(+) symporter BenE family transporter [Photobacterium damselae]
MKNFFNINYITAGFTAVLIGYSSSAVIIIQAAQNAGASPLEIESWLFSLGISLGVISILLSWRYKMPILMAWSTPGAVMLVNSVSGYSLSIIIGAFIVSGILTLITAFITPLNKALTRIPPQIGTAMLAGILVPYTVKGFETITSSPILFIVMFITLLIMRKTKPNFTMLILIMISIVFCWVQGTISDFHIGNLMSKPIFISPKFSYSSIFNLAIPLFIITMLSQNIPGITILNTYGFTPPIKQILLTSSISNIFLAPFGVFSSNLAAISATICMNKDVDIDERKRYLSVLWAGCFYIIAGLFSGFVVKIFLSLPTDLIRILVSFSLLNTVVLCLHTAFNKTEHHYSAMLTFLITLSNISFFGINSILLGLFIGITHYKFLDKKIKL